VFWSLGPLPFVNLSGGSEGDRGYFVKMNTETFDFLPLRKCVGTAITSDVPLAGESMAPQLKPQAEPVSAFDWSPVCHITYTRDTWVKLTTLLNPCAADEAQLLCQASPDTWVVWVPDHGEAVLNKSHFYV
jgi:hypothetical protein